MLWPFLQKIAAHEDLSAPEAHEAMLIILSGAATTPQISAFLMGLRMKGETPQELLGFARAMREKTVRIDACVDPEPLLDTCGTGGGAGSTFNISTVAAFVVAGAGARVAKHGNRSFSTHCGSADILEHLGVAVSQPPERIAQAIREIGIGFLFAPLLHPAMKHAQPARMELKMRTVFNLLGPLTNPAGATRQLIGAPSAAHGGADGQCAGGAGTGTRVCGSWRRSGRSDHYGDNAGVRDHRQPGAFFPLDARGLRRSARPTLRTCAAAMARTMQKSPQRF